ncbi:MAG: hypothetical protein EA376_08540 [Phycisphaeraceae bacterium]|nr:MAG: hypothetical protein EA376_08540 [Phycisphaeraceae bacterium]
MCSRSLILAVAGLFVGALAAAPALAQFSPPGQQTSIQERIIGVMLPTDENPDPPQPGDQLAAFFDDEIIGLYAFTSDQDDPRSFRIRLFGNDPETEATEGPNVGQAVSFRFFRSLTNTVINAQVIEPGSGQPFNFTFQGSEVPPFDFPDLPIDLVPQRNFNMRLGAASGNGGNGGGGGGDGPNYDVNGDGRVTREDAALVIRIMVGARRGLSEDVIRRADVNGDGTVDSKDVIAIYRHIRGD